MMFARFVFSAFALVLLAGAWAEESTGPAPGHSIHGEAWNEGPRQAAVLIEGTGEIDFPVTVANEQARAFFLQGVGQLHGYWDFEAERSFRQAAAIDPDCAMAYWGMACANFKNEERAKGFIAEAAKRENKATDRERAWIAAYHDYFTTEGDKKKRLRELVRAHEEIARDYPDDVEAKAFLLRQIYHNHGRGGLPITSHYSVNLLADAILKARPLHPSNHYRIHLWDREKAELALESAANCGPSAPGIAHMWHMPGHVYTKENRYLDAAWQQEASARIDHAHMMRFQIMPGRIHNFAHNNEWLTRNLLHVGRAHDAADLARNMISLPRLGKFEKGHWKQKGSGWAYGRQRLRDAFLQFERYGALREALRKGILSEGPDGFDETEIARLEGIALAETGHREEAKKKAAKLRGKLAKAEGEQLKAKADAGKKARDAEKTDKQIADSEKKASATFEKRIKSIRSALEQVEAHLAVTARPLDGEAARKAVDALDSNEISKARLTALHLRAANPAKALEVAEEDLKTNPTRFASLAARVEALHMIGKDEAELRKAFEILRVEGGHADDDVPVFTRLAAIGATLGFPKDWRSPAPPAADLGERPSLDSLGPFRWAPSRAPGYALFDAEAEVFTSADHHGTPVILLFYLGGRCSHCLEQLEAFAKKKEAFEDAGLRVITIGTDKRSELADVEFEGGADVPFAMLSDSDLVAFKAFRAYDDFEEAPMHGTFLIDESGLIRWQDIGHQPFMEPEWLIEESVRLLSFEIEHTAH